MGICIQSSVVDKFRGSDRVFHCRSPSPYHVAARLSSIHSHQNNKQTVNQKVMTSAYMLTKQTITTLTRYVDSLLSYIMQYLYSKTTVTANTHTHTYACTHKYNIIHMHAPQIHIHTVCIDGPTASCAGSTSHCAACDQLHAVYRARRGKPKTEK